MARAVQLLRWQQVFLDQVANAMVRHTELGGRLGHRQPFAILSAERYARMSLTMAQSLRDARSMSCPDRWEAHALSVAAMCSSAWAALSALVGGARGAREVASDEGRLVSSGGRARVGACGRRVVSWVVGMPASAGCLRAGRQWSDEPGRDAHHGPPTGQGRHGPRSRRLAALVNDFARTVRRISMAYG